MGYKEILVFSMQKIEKGACKLRFLPQKYKMTETWFTGHQ